MTLGSRTGNLAALWMLLVALAAACVLAPEDGDPISSPSATSTERSAEKVFLTLRGRELRFPDVAKGRCPFAGAIHLPGIPAEAGLGPGTDPEDLYLVPVYTVFRGIPRILDLFSPTRDGWRSARILVVSRPAYTGAVLVRGDRLDAPGPVGFGPAPERERELRLPFGPWEEARDPVHIWGRTARPRAGWRVAVAEMSMRAGGCYGLQIDGLRFSYPITFPVLWQE
jgi:hypothetical protein